MTNENENPDRLGYSRSEKIKIFSLYGGLAAFTIFCFICATVRASNIF